MELIRLYSKFGFYRTAEVNRIRFMLQKCNAGGHKESVPFHTDEQHNLNIKFKVP